MLYALEHEVCFDLFVVYTDNETSFGSMHPAEALRVYREASGINARLAP
jgi:60 kDa SS-A/Ro ribonucleoprotein